MDETLLVRCAMHFRASIGELRRRVIFTYQHVPHESVSEFNHIIIPNNGDPHPKLTHRFCFSPLYALPIFKGKNSFRSFRPSHSIMAPRLNTEMYLINGCSDIKTSSNGYRLKRLRVVSFVCQEDLAIVHEDPAVSLSDDEIAACWYSQAELETIRLQIKETVERKSFP